MNYTPLAHLTDEELLRAVYMKEDVTDHELELAQRLDYAKEYIDALREDAGIELRQVATKYKAETCDA